MMVKSLKYTNNIIFNDIYSIKIKIRIINLNISIYIVWIISHYKIINKKTFDEIVAPLNQKEIHY